MTVTKSVDGVDVPLTVAEQAELEARVATPVRRTVSKPAIRQRLKDAGKSKTVLTFMQANPDRLLWFITEPVVYADDEALLAILTGGGCTQVQIDAITADG